MIKPTCCSIASCSHQVYLFIGAKLTKLINI